MSNINTGSIRQKLSTNSNDHKTTIRVNGIVVGEYTGIVTLEVQSAGFTGVGGTTFTVQGDVRGNVDGTNVTCGNVGGDVDGTNVTCGAVAGKIRAINVTTRSTR